MGGNVSLIDGHIDEPKKRYIDVEKFIRDLQDEYHGMISDESLKIYKIIHRLDATPTADVVEVKHGEWVKHSPDVAAMRAFHKLGIGKGMGENSIFWTCSCCDSWGTLTQNYCPNCGAKMDGERK